MTFKNIPYLSAKAAVLAASRSKAGGTRAHYAGSFPMYRSQPLLDGAFERYSP